MTLIAITGASGRMGKNIISCIKENPNATLSAALEMPGHASIGKDAGVIAGLEPLGVKITDEPLSAFKKADVVIDFSAHEAAMKNLETALMLRKPVVIGTTGFSLHQKVRIKEISAAVPLVLAPNMSVGVNVLLKLLEVAAKTLGDDYDVEIVEYHHRHKVDAPSGTALRIAEVLAHSLERDLDKVAVYGRKGITGERKKEEIGIQSVRAGDIVGDHIVTFGGDGERIELIHRAHSRTTFARGAVKAALWLKDKPSGLYDMQDVLGLK